MKAALAALLVAASAAHAAERCPAAEVVAPGKGETIASARPAIEWRALPGVGRYRVQVESRVPEGQVLWRADTLVAGTRFVPPAALEISARTMTWGKVAGAQRYEVAAYSSLDGRSLLQAESLEPAYRLPRLEQAAYVMLRARCAQAYSAPVYRVLAAPSER